VSSTTSLRVSAALMATNVATLDYLECEPVHSAVLVDYQECEPVHSAVLVDYMECKPVHSAVPMDYLECEPVHSAVLVLQVIHQVRLVPRLSRLPAASALWRLLKKQARDQFGDCQKTSPLLNLCSSGMMARPTSSQLRSGRERLQAGVTVGETKDHLQEWMPTLKYVFYPCFLIAMPICLLNKQTNKHEDVGSCILTRIGEDVFVLFATMHWCSCATS
jgi:hypothetical protein